MNDLKKEYEQVLESWQAEPQKFVFPSGYAPEAAKLFVNPWGFVPSKLVVVGQTKGTEIIGGQPMAAVLYFTDADQRQWTKEHLRLRNTIFGVTYKLLAFR